MSLRLVASSMIRTPRVLRLGSRSVPKPRVLDCPSLSDPVAADFAEAPAPASRALAEVVAEVQVRAAGLP
jgi:hypothetical protein